MTTPKSKKQKRKQAKASPKAKTVSVPPVGRPVASVASTDTASDNTTAIWMTLILLIAVAVVLTLLSHYTGNVKLPANSRQSSGENLPSSGSATSQSLSPSGSVELQPSSSASQPSAPQY